MVHKSINETLQAGFFSDKDADKYSRQRSTANRTLQPKQELYQITEMENKKDPDTSCLQKTENIGKHLQGIKT